MAQHQQLGNNSYHPSPSEDEVAEMLNAVESSIEAESDWPQKLMEEFDDVISDTINPKPMKGKPVKIVLKPEAVPYKAFRARKVPLHLQEDAMKLLDQMQKDNILLPMEDWEESEWIHPSSFVIKPGGNGVRLVVDTNKI